MENLKKLVGEEVFKTHIEPKLTADKKYFFGEGEFIPSGRFNEVINQVKDYKAQIAERDKQIEELKKSASGNEELTKKLNELTEANKKQKDEYEAKLQKQEFDFAYNTVLGSTGAKDLKVLDALIDKQKIVFKDGKFAGLQEQIDALKKTHDWAFNAPGTPTPNQIGVQIIPGSNTSLTQKTNVSANNLKPWNRTNRII